MARSLVAIDPVMLLEFVALCHAVNIRVVGSGALEGKVELLVEGFGVPNIPESTGTVALDYQENGVQVTITFAPRA